MRRGFKRITLLACLALLFPASLWAGGEGEGFNFEDKLNHHLMDSVIFELNLFSDVKIRPGDPGYENPAFIRRYEFRDEQGLYKYSGGLPMHITRRVAMMMVASLILCLVLIVAARKIAGNPHRINGRLANGVESVVQWVRHDIAHEGMHDHSKGFEPYILTLFFFLLTLNMFGLFPPIGEAIVKIYGAVSGHAHAHEPGSLESPLLAIWPGITVTGDVAVTFTMAFIAMLMMWITGFRYQGVKFLWHVVPNGVPWPLYVIMWPLEFIVGPVARAFALTIRLLANMTAGHVLLLALIGFIFMARDLWFGGPVGVVGGAGITLISVAGAVAIYMLEILVAFLQAFIFSVLTSLFIGSMMHRH